MKKWLKEMRVSHYAKNTLIFVPAFFGGNLLDITIWGNLLAGFLAFCLLSSFVYIVNDIKDVEKDRQNEQKKHRPIAAGEITVPCAVTGAVICLILSYLISFLFISRENFPSAVIVMTIYFFINICYSIFRLKDIPLLDVVILAGGFYLRLQMGSVITGISISDWLYLVVLTGAFYLGFGKRRNELRQTEQMGDSKDTTRKVLKFYTLDFLDKSMTTCMTMAMIFFSLWSIERKGGTPFILATPFLMIICFRYNMDLEKKECTGDPVTTILADKILLALIVLLILFMFAFIYIGGE